jgi:hypothetical protein
MAGLAHQGVLALELYVLGQHRGLDDADEFVLCRFGAGPGSAGQGLREKHRGTGDAPDMLAHFLGPTF